MIKKLMNELMEAKTPGEILAFKPQILGLYNSLYDKISAGCCITNYEDIKNLHDLNFTMMTYFGSCFYNKCGIPFLMKYNHKTIDVIEFTILFYTLQILELLEKGFLDTVPLCIYEDAYNKEMELFDRVENIKLTAVADKFGKNLFGMLWLYFRCIITVENKNREITIEYSNGADLLIDVFYLDDEEYEKALDIIYKNYNGSKYSCIIHKILGVYRMRFTKMEYILKYQPLFVEVGYRYLCEII